MRYAKPQILWGPTFENVLEVGYPLDEQLTGRRPLEGSERALSPGGAEDAWTTGRQYELDAVLRWAPHEDTADPLATAWSGAQGVQAFLDAARDAQQFRYVPDAAVPDFYVPSYLKGPFEDPGGLEEDGTHSLPVTLRNKDVDYGLAMRGLMFEYAAGGSITDPAAATFARALAAHQVNPKGTTGEAAIVLAASGALRDRHWLGASGTIRTALVEPARENVLVRSREFEHAAWGKTNTTITANDQAGPDGAVKADKFDQTAAANGFTLQEVAETGHANKRYVFSLSLKRGTLTGNFKLRLRDGADTEVGLSASLNPSSSQWTRFSVAGTFGATPAANIRVYLDPENDAGTGTYFVDAAQLENVPLGVSEPSSFIETTTAKVTRPADQFTWAFGHRPQPMFLYAKLVHAQGLPTEGFPRILDLGTTTFLAPNLVLARGGGAFYAITYLDGAGGSSADAGSPPAAGDTYEILGLLKADYSAHIRTSINGAAEVAGGTGAAATRVASWGATPRLAICQDLDVTSLLHAGVVQVKVGPLTFAGVTRDTIAKVRAA